MPPHSQLALPPKESSTALGPAPDLEVPRTRYQGSKYRLIPWLHERLSDLQFDTALDAFGGTAAVSYLMSRLGKEVVFNDYLLSNVVMARALLGASGVRLDRADLDLLFNRHSDMEYDDFIERTFSGVYFTDAENAWLDQTVQNIPLLDSESKRDLAHYALFQSCIVKRPYNLFHRKNLYMRLAAVERSFGNKTTWDTPFPVHFERFARAAAGAQFQGERGFEARHGDARKATGSFDLVYLDPPYLNERGTGVDYFGFYHFLEGLLRYKEWEERIDWKRKHLPLKGKRSGWDSKRTIDEAFQELFQAHASSTLVLSYRDNGVPSPARLRELLTSVKSSVEVFDYGQFQYALSTDRRSKELLFVAS